MNLEENLEDLINSSWQTHATDPHRVAQVLQANRHLVGNAEQAASFLRLSNHAIGEHLQDWTQAHELAKVVLAPLAHTADAINALVSLAVAQWLVGDTAAALATQTRIVALDPAQATVNLVRIAAQIVSGLVAVGRINEGAELYQSLLIMQHAPADASVDRVLAVTSNNVASDLLNKIDCSAAQTRLMLDAAAAALVFWRRCGTWVHEERARYLQALVHNKIGRAEVARAHAIAALALIHVNRADRSDEAVDEAFLELALAHACLLLGDSVDGTVHLARADALAGDFADAGLEQWFATERAKLPSC